MAFDGIDLGAWSYGLHPEGPGAVIGQMSRTSLPLGEALRIEMTDFGSTGVVHVQYYIASESGGVAVWTSCPPSELSERLATLEAISPPITWRSTEHDPAPARRDDEQAD